MPVIELIGCPGSGKSTIYNELKKCRTEGEISQNYIFSKDLLNRQSNGFISKLINKIFLKKRTQNNIIKKSMMISAEKYSHENEVLIQMIWDLIDNSKYDYRGIHQGLRISYGLYQSLIRHSFLVENYSDKMVIVDEGILHKLANIFHNDNQEKITNILSRLTYPSVIIMCTCPVEVIYERAKSRSSVMYSYDTNNSQILSETKRKIAGANLIFDFYKNKGNRVIKIDTSSNKKNTSMDKILNVLNTQDFS